MAKAKKSSSKKSITVSLIKLGQEPQELTLPKGSTLSDALIAGGHGETSLKEVAEGVRVNREVVGLDHVLEHEDWIVVSPQVKGGR